MQYFIIYEEDSKGDRNTHGSIFGSLFTQKSFWFPDTVLTYDTTSQSKCRFCFYDNLSTKAFLPPAIETGAEEPLYSNIIVPWTGMMKCK